MKQAVKQGEHIDCRQTFEPGSGGTDAGGAEGGGGGAATNGGAAEALCRLADPQVERARVRSLLALVTMALCG